MSTRSSRVLFHAIEIVFWSVSARSPYALLVDGNGAW